MAAGLGILGAIFDDPKPAIEAGQSLKYAQYLNSIEEGLARMQNQEQSVAPVKEEQQTAERTTSSFRDRVTSRRAMPELALAENTR